jgi:hypothetical protein
MCYTLFLSGCAALYTVERGGKTYNNGYVVKRNNVIIPEFTIDTKNAAPDDPEIARQRFKRRRHKILKFYEQMGYFRITAVEDGKFFVSAIAAPFRAPVEGLKINKYEHDPEYRAKVDAQDEEEENKEQEKLKAIEAKMKDFIVQDLKVEQKDK